MPSRRSLRSGKRKAAAGTSSTLQTRSSRARKVKAKTTSVKKTAIKAKAAAKTIRAAKKATKRTVATRKASNKVAKKTTRKASSKKKKSASSSGVPASMRGYTPAEFKIYKAAEKKYGGMTNEKLKEYLKVNLQSRSGDKAKLILKCSDGEALGGMPRCPTCGLGFIRFNQKTGEYKCPGAMDDDEFVNCSAKFRKSEITREKWVSP
ncbi:unnamed protein product [Moneuplotes crassus]|uniref:PARP1-like PADR1 domain-containing protein n=1 Tax=Euplotes crassus TaxID=5936 RepID=A0AAD1XU30_EUPCR|nr:unnamed protein product [Moneuplotes crassus]